MTAASIRPLLASLRDSVPCRLAGYLRAVRIGVRAGPTAPPTQAVCPGGGEVCAGRDSKWNRCGAFSHTRHDPLSIHRTASQVVQYSTGADTSVAFSWPAPP